VTSSSGSGNEEVIGAPSSSQATKRSFVFIILPVLSGNEEVINILVLIRPLRQRRDQICKRAAL